MREWKHRWTIMTASGGVLIALLAAVNWYFWLGPGDVTPWLIHAGWLEDPNAPLVATGLLEAVQVAVSAEVRGQVESLQVAEGDPVKAGDLLLTLDDALLQAQLAEAEAAIRVAKAALDQVEAGTREEKVRQAEAVLAGANAARDGAYQALQDTQAMRADPQELDDRIDQARTQVEIASHLVMQAVAVKDAVELVKDNVDALGDQLESGYTVHIPLPDGQVHSIHLGGTDLSRVHGLLKHQYWYAWTLINTAGAARDGAQNALNELLRIREHPHELEAKVAEARERYQVAEAMVEVAQAKLNAIQAGPTQEQLELARGRIREAEASKQLAQTQQAKTRIYAPIDGTVVELPLRAGESAQQGVRLAVIADLAVVNLQVYIPESELGRVHMGQQASVTVDPFPDRAFEGQVTHIASEAEYMPRGVQSKEQRVNMVFAVRIQLDNSQYLLKPGMSADVAFRAEDSDG